jgi:hypothetical protein
MSPVARAAATGAALLMLAPAAAAAAPPAPVPPRDCGRMELRGKSIQIKADRVRCTTARRYAKGYVVQRRTPPGWKCRRYTGGTKLAFRCLRGDQTFFGIRRGR